jgi:uncharacterized protein HemX
MDNTQNTQNTQQAGTLRLDRTITVGAILQILTLVIGFGGALLAFGGRQERAEATARDVASLRQTVSEQAATTREALTAQAAGTRDTLKESVGRIEGALQGVQTQIQALPTMTERVRQIEAAIAELKERNAGMDTRVEQRRLYVDAQVASVRSDLIQTRADLDAIRRASAVNLPGSRGARP